MGHPGKKALVIAAGASFLGALAYLTLRRYRRSTDPQQGTDKEVSMADAEERHVEDRLEDARTFLWNAFGLDLDHINSDGKMRSNTRSAEKLAEIDRERSLGRTMADNLDQVFRHLVSSDEFGHITWQGFMAKIAEDLLSDYNWSLSHYERMFTQHPPRVEAEPVVIRERDTETLDEERPRRRFTPLRKEEEPEHPTAWDKLRAGFRTQRRRDIED